MTDSANSKMPALFLGHGSPMNAVQDNDYTQSLARLAQSIPVPKRILMISAHWTTKGTWLTHMQRPKTIHDFFGFPDELFKIQYPAPGDLDYSQKIKDDLESIPIHLDSSEWGLDHGAWSVLRHLYPQANIPVIQLSLDMTQEASFHYNLGKSLKKYRHEQTLIIGSGNIVHNLKQIQWDTNAPTYPWCIDFDKKVKESILKKDYNSIGSQLLKSESGKLSHPTPEHFYPLLYILGTADDTDKVHFTYEGFQNASISMRCLQLG